ncbi:hypothetical protein MYX07_01835 [Patescibacteria group bacterium AH-259-L07]|nr:hypothetical protein [Patescibacteria group bacterium AH-259-L07]
MDLSHGVTALYKSLITKTKNQQEDTRMKRYLIEFGMLILVLFLSIGCETDLLEPSSLPPTITNLVEFDDVSVAFIPDGNKTEIRIQSENERPAEVIIFEAIESHEGEETWVVIFEEGIPAYDGSNFPTYSYWLNISEGSILRVQVTIGIEGWVAIYESDPFTLGDG